MGKSREREINHYTHQKNQRLNNPPVGLVTPDTDQDIGTTGYSFDPHLDPQLEWSGKEERLSFEIHNVSLHVHERIDPRTIVHALGKSQHECANELQSSLFALEEENPPFRDAIEFYKHEHNWCNRIVAGDSLLVMNSLVEKEGLGNQVQMVYVDPPYGIKYRSNFQPFVTGRNVSESDKDDDLTREPEMLRAFRDTWELGIHSYLSYLRDRLLLARKMLKESGSIFVQISDENLHLVRNLLDEIFGPQNFISIIAFKKKKMPLGESFIFTMCDYLIWYGKDKSKSKFRRLFLKRDLGEGTDFSYVELLNGQCLTISECIKQFGKVPSGAKYFQSMDMRSSGRTEGCVFEFDFNGKKFFPSGGRSWKTNEAGMKRLQGLNRLFAPGNSLRYKYFYDDYPVMELSHMWMDTQGATRMTYVVQTPEKVVQRCILMTTDPGDLVFDPTCGAGTTALVAEHWGRRWITCDTSRVALTLAKQRLMCAVFPFYSMAHPSEGLASGFVYRTARHVTLGSLTGEASNTGETLYDQPVIDKERIRVSGPFTVEAVPAPTVMSLDKFDNEKSHPADGSLSRTGETLRQGEWCDELLKTGIRGKGGQRLTFSLLETMTGTRWLHADGETIEMPGRRVVISFGPEHFPLEQRQVALAIQEAQTLVPIPSIIIFASFQFDSEASKDIDEINWPGATLLKTQMNADLFTNDLTRNRASNESYWLIGQPDVRLDKLNASEETPNFQISIHGFDYYNTRTGAIESGDANRIAMWMLDPDYDGRSLFPRQVFFPMKHSNIGWSTLERTLLSELDSKLIEAHRGTVSQPFKIGKFGQAGVKIIDDRGIESFKVVELE